MQLHEFINDESSILYPNWKKCEEKVIKNYNGNRVRIPDGLLKRPYSQRDIAHKNLDKAFNAGDFKALDHAIMLDEDEKVPHYIFQYKFEAYKHSGGDNKKVKRQKTDNN